MIPALIDIESHIILERLNQGRQLFTDGPVAAAGPGGSSRTVTPDPGRGLAGILAVQQRKQALADGLYQGGGNHEPRWSEQDLEMLFEPLDA